MASDEDLHMAALLAATRTIALVGASHKPERDSYRVMAFLIDCGYQLFPINPGLAGQSLLGRPVYASLADIPEAPDLVDIFRRLTDVLPVVEEAISSGAKGIWLQQGLALPAAAAMASTHGLACIMDKCPKQEIPRLRRLGLL
jgi:predicted CoA-binding protein